MRNFKMKKIDRDSGRRSTQEEEHLLEIEIEIEMRAW